MNIITNNKDSLSYKRPSSSNLNTCSSSKKNKYKVVNAKNVMSCSEIPSLTNGNNLKTANKPAKPFADINHKKSTGTNNWSKFMAETGMDRNVSSRGSQKSFSKKAEDTKKPQEKAAPILTKVVALDCEMVGIGEGGRDDMLARVSIVNSLGECLYDTFVKARDTVKDYRTAVSGVRPKDMENGRDFIEVQKEVATILNNRILVGHALKSDFKVLYLNHPKHLVRDTSKFFRQRGHGTPSLKNLALAHLGTAIQQGEHNSIQDAKAAMQLYSMYKKYWETGPNKLKNNYYHYFRSMN